ncbi:hypothetical protein F5Y01DRAFT_304766 [Xylaria sp. FL0043]|nr:hypothetical protein F5Y01DRAFT_304766 [Xylaria sp. FL0043]
MESTSESEETARELKPVLGTTLFKRETERRKKLHERGVIPTGCSEIDDALLLGGGFEGGCVVGVSAEEVEFGILLGLQTIARALVFERGGRKQRATIITTLPVTTILPTLRDIIRYQVQSKLGARNSGSDDELRRCLEAISISRIFDIEGLWEVLRELDEARNETRLRHNEDGNEEMTSPPAPEDSREENVSSEAKNATVSLENEQNEGRGSAGTGIEKAVTDLATITPSRAVQESRASSSEPVTQLPPLRVGPELRPLARNSEILDSEDEEPLSSSPLSSPPPSTVAPQSPSPSEHHSQPHTEQDPSPAVSVDPEPKERPQELDAPPSEPVANLPPPVPEFILVTHFSALLTTLFTHNDKTSAHRTLQLLSSHLRNLALSTEALIMLLNTTTSSSPEPSTSTSAAASGPFPEANQPITPLGQETTKQQRPLDATLRSIFNLAPPPQHQQQQHLQGPNQHDHQGQRPGYGYGYGHAASRLTRRNKPSFGATFAQFLDLHLLCTRVPRTREDAETAIALGPGLGSGGEDVKYAWVVEVLLDELGFYDWGGLEKKRKGKMAMMAMGKDKDKDKEREKAQGDDGLPPRVNREQRWAAVDVRDRVVVVNAFGASGSAGVNRGPVRVIGGFGGPRV